MVYCDYCKEVGDCLGIVLKKILTISHKSKILHVHMIFITVCDC